MSSIRISMKNHVAAIIAQLIRSDMEAAFDWPQKEWDEVMEVVTRLEWKVNWKDPLVNGEGKSDG